MLSVANVRTAGGAANYFAADNYYTRADAGRSGEWLSKGAQKLGLAAQHGVVGPHIGMLYAIRDALPEALGRPLPINVNGAIPAVMLDVGFPVAALKGISLLARTASLIAHLQEETERPIGFVMSGAAAAAIEYDGPRG